MGLSTCNDGAINQTWTRENGGLCNQGQCIDTGNTGGVETRSYNGTNINQQLLFYPYQ